MTVRRHAVPPHDRVLATATRLFLEHGIQAVSIRRIIAEADVAQMTPYRRFSGKDELVAASLEQWGGHWLHWLTDRIERRGDDPNARWAGLWDAIEEWRTADGRHGSLILTAAAELRGTPDHPANAVIEAHQRAVRQVLEDLAKQTGADDPTTLAAELHVVLEGTLTAAVVDRWPPHAPSARAVADAVLAAHLAAAGRTIDRAGRTP
jgi:AcrR family transcriptional regulator